MLTNDEKGWFYYDPKIQMRYFVVVFFVTAQHTEPVFSVFFLQELNSILLLH